MYLLIGLALAAVPTLELAGKPGPMPSPSLEPLSETVTITQLSDGVFRIRSQPWDVNTLVVLQPDGSPVLVDTPATPRDTRLVLDWMSRELGRLPAVSFSSHFHSDASGGNQELRKRGIPIVGSSKSAALHTEHTASMITSMAEKDPAFAEIVGTPPTHTVDERTRVQVGGGSILVVYPGAAHAADNVVVLFEDRGLLYGGCMLKSGDSLGYLGHADVPSWRGAMDVVAALEPTTVVPGHGDSTSPAIIAHTTTLVDAALAETP